jgi:hypothetical protein
MYATASLVLVGWMLVVYQSHRQTTSYTTPESSSSVPLLQGTRYAKIGSAPVRDVQGPTIGQRQLLHTVTIRPVVPHPAMILRKPFHTWIVKVPLTPFTAPRIKLPILETPPRFLLYNPRYLSPVRNQGDCGACWAFALCDMLSDRLMIQTRGRFRQNLSVQELLSCYAPDGCDGGSPEEACQWMEETQFQLTSESMIPYQEASGGAVTTPCPTKTYIPRVGIRSGSVRSLVEFIPEQGYDHDILQQNIQNMKQMLIQQGPFYCAMAVYDDLFTYTGTHIYTHSKSSTLVGGHAIEIIGYCDAGIDPRAGFKQAYWICRNSWGNEWPTQTELDGYFTIAMGKNECGIESRCGMANPVIIGSFQELPPLALSTLRFTTFYSYMNV